MNVRTGLRPGDLVVTPTRWLRWLWLPVAFAVVAVALWWLGHPQELATPDRTVSATATAGRIVYVGVTDTSQAGRQIMVSSVAIPEPRGEDVTVKAWVCRGGSIAQTSDPTRFCSEIVEAEEQPMTLGSDQLMLSVQSETAQKVSIGRVTVSYRDGLQRAEQEAGPTFEVEFVG